MESTAGEMKIATIGKRAGAWIIDTIIISIPLVVVFAFLSVSYAGRTDPINMLEGRLELLKLKKILMGIGLGLAWLYSSLFESSIYQATPGKRILGIAVTDVNGQRINFGRAAGRAAVKYLLSNIFGIGYLIALFTEKRQALHDLLAECLVLDKTEHGQAGLKVPQRGKEAIDDSAFYEAAMKECEGGVGIRKESTWAKAYALTEGVENKAKAKYIELRVAEMVEQERKRQEELKEQERREKAEREQRLLHAINSHYKTLHHHFGTPVLRMSSESDAGYAARLLRFAKEYEKTTGKKLE